MRLVAALRGRMGGPVTGLPLPLLQTLPDGPGRMGAPEDGLFVKWDAATGKFVMAVAGGASEAYVDAGDAAVLGQIVTDHGALTGLADDDHGQYLLVNGTRAMTGNLMLQNTGGLRSVGSDSTGLFFTAATTWTMRNNNVTNVAASSGGISFGPAFPATNVQQLYVVQGGIKLGSQFSPQGYVLADAATHVPLAVKLAASQTANAFRVVNSAESVLAYVNAGGAARFTGIGVNVDPPYFGSSIGTSGLIIGGLFGFSGSSQTTLSLQSGLLRVMLQNAAGITGFRVQSDTAGVIATLAAGGIATANVPHGFFGVAAVAQAALLADPAADAADLATWAASINTLLKNYGLMATS